MDEISRFIETLNRRAPAREQHIAACEAVAGGRLPRDYVNFLTISDGGEGHIGQDSYVILWSICEVIPLNEAYDVKTYAPGLLIFGSNGGGEAYGFDTRTAPWKVVEIPFVGMDWSLARPFGTFTEFLAHLFRAQ